MSREDRGVYYSERIKSLTDLYLFKLAALMHDPPHKHVNLRIHKRLARKMANEIFRNVNNRVRILNNVEIVFKEALLDAFKHSIINGSDTFASNIDRYVLSIIYDHTGYSSSFSVDSITLKNAILPTVKKDISKDRQEFTRLVERYYRDFISSFKKLVQSLLGRRTEGGDRDAQLSWEDVSKLYHLFYAFYEYLWVKNGLPLSPEDTRVPTSSIFDHLYATAAAVNTHYGGDLVIVDVGRVQEFISGSRKLRDMWSASYMVSALVWYTISEVVELLGPDVVVYPSLRFNPFYLHWLKGYLGLEEGEGTGGRGSLEKEFRGLIEHVYMSREAASLYERLGLPPYAVMPARVFLILPRYEKWMGWRSGSRGGEGGWEEYFRRRFEEGWRKLVESLKLSPACFPNPFTVYVVSEKIRESGERVEWYRYTKSYSRLLAKLYHAKRVSFGIGSSPRNMSLDGREADRDFKYCSVCKKFPAVVWKTTKNKLKCRIWLDESVRRRLEPVLSEGERLCRVCLVKRLASVDLSGFRALLSSGEGSGSQGGGAERRLWIPSLSHISSYEFLDSIRSRLGNAHNIDELEGLCGGSGRSSGGGQEEVALWSWLNEIGDSGVEGVFKRFVRVDPEGEECYLSSSMSKRQRVLRRLREIFGRGLRGPGTYYALVRVDADRVGYAFTGAYFRLLSGCSGGRGECAERYLEASVENEYLRKAIKCLIKVSLDKSFYESAITAIKYVFRSGRVPCKVITYENINRIIRDLEKNLCPALLENYVPVSLSYHVAVSSALMRAALLDVYLVSRLGGVVVYAGGDDLLAVLPTSKVGRFLAASRRLFAGLPYSREGCPGQGAGSDGGGPGVEVGGGFLWPRGNGHAVYSMLLPVGRSYVAYIAHYRYPLGLVLSRSRELLKRAKRAAWESSGVDPWAASYGDVAVVAYNARGKENVFTLPLRDAQWVRRYMGGGVEARGLGGVCFGEAWAAFNGRCAPDLAALPVVVAHELYRCIRDGRLSTGLARDFSERYSSLVEQLVEMGRCGEAVDVFRACLARNVKAGGEEGAESLLGQLADRVYRAMGGRTVAGREDLWGPLFQYLASWRLPVSGGRSVLEDVLWVAYVFYLSDSR